MLILKQLRRKFIYSIILIQMLVFAIILLALNIVITKRETNEARHFLYLLSTNNGRRPAPHHPGKNLHDHRSVSPDVLSDIDATSSATREHSEDFLLSLSTFFNYEKANTINLRNYFAVKVLSNGILKEIINDFPLSYTNDEIQRLVDKAFHEDKNIGSIDGIMYNVRDLRNGEYIICFLNRNSELKTLGKFYIYSFILYILSIIVSALISIPISKYMLKPTSDAFMKQKQFIADASHELKTPIAVIGANIDVLEGEIHNNKWLGYIKAENKRMGELVKDLLYLAKNDVGRNDLTFSDFDFSNAVENSVLPFEVLAFESGKTLELNIEKGIICTGDEKSIKQVCIILLDNALKNSENGAKISVTAVSDERKIIYKVYNTGTGIRKEELEKIFLRFYRSDSSRVRKTGGYGLGLAIARTIAQDHGGTLVANSEYGKWAEFTLTIPKKK